MHFFFLIVGVGNLSLARSTPAEPHPTLEVWSGSIRGGSWGREIPIPESKSHTLIQFLEEKKEKKEENIIKGWGKKKISESTNGTTDFTPANSAL